jgi:hypothetical protein
MVAARVWGSRAGKVVFSGDRIPVLFFCFVVLGIEPGALGTLGEHSIRCTKAPALEFLFYKKKKFWSYMVISDTKWNQALRCHQTVLST